MTANQGWKKAPCLAQCNSNLRQDHPITVQTPSYPSLHIPLAASASTSLRPNFPQMSNPGQFTAPQMKSLQGGPSRVPTPCSSPTSPTSLLPPHPPPFQQDPLLPPQRLTNQQMGPRPPQNNPLPQGFQQPVSSPGRNPMVQQGNVPPNFMGIQQQPLNQGPQSLHPGLEVRSTGAVCVVN